MLCRAFHYYSSKSRHKIQKSPRLIVHYPKLHAHHFPSNSINSINVSESSLKNHESSSIVENKKQSKTLDEISLEFEYSASSLETCNNEISTFSSINQINSVQKNDGNSLERKIYSQSQSHNNTPMMMMMNKFSKNSTLVKNNNNNNPKDINVKSGCTDFVHEKPSLETNNNNNAQVEYLYSRDLFLFEYRKRPNVKSEGTQSDNKKTGSSRIFRF